MCYISEKKRMKKDGVFNILIDIQRQYIQKGSWYTKKKVKRNDEIMQIIIVIKKIGREERNQIKQLLQTTTNKKKY